MENMQFSFLTALFGGKFAGDALANNKANGQGDPAAKDAEGFFTFIEGMLKSAAATDDESDNLLAGELLAGQTQTHDPLEAKAFRDQLDGKFIAEGTFKTPGSATGQFGPSVDPIRPRLGALVLDAPQREAAPTTETLSGEAALVVFGKDATATNGTILALQAASPQAIAQPVITAPQGLQKMGAPVDEAVSQPADILEIEPGLDARGRDGASRFDAPLLRTHFEGPNIVLPPQANAALAIADHAAPDALVHSAVMREGVAALDADRFAASRLEIVSHATDRNAHLNPIRDQVVAAVAARHGDGKLEIRLDPPELGKILIGFDRDGTNIVRAVISADSPETLDLMRRHADVFQRALEAQGFENLDLHFADKGPGENANDMAEETFKNFRLADEAGQADAMSSAPALVDGRLDRRL
jgi:hypothetical protein